MGIIKYYSSLRARIKTRDNYFFTRIFISPVAVSYYYYYYRYRWSLVGHRGWRIQLKAILYCGKRDYRPFSFRLSALVRLSYPSTDTVVIIIRSWFIRKLFFFSLVCTQHSISSYAFFFSWISYKTIRTASFIFWFSAIPISFRRVRFAKEIVCAPRY